MSLSVNSISAYYGNIRVLWEVSLHVSKGEIVALLGANGAGKSTLLRSIMGLVRFRGGDILFEDKSIKGMRPHKVVEKGIGYVSEGRRLFGTMSVEENLRLGAPRNCEDLSSRMETAYGLFPVLRERKNQRSATLSGGEQQMVAIARSLMARPKLLLLDELSFGLSPKMFERVLIAIEQANLSGVTILMAEQNTERALEVSSRAYVIENGRKVAEGASKELIDDPKLREAYIGLAE
jgi:branched-chain amino acid transport system ATP-binding protein